MPVKRKNWIDVAKGVAICLVCAGHSQIEKIAPIGSWIYSFHMAFFFLIAGYCYNPHKYTHTGDYVVRKLKGLMWPYLALSAFSVLLEICLRSGYGFADFGRLFLVPYPGCGVIGFWFVRVLLVAEVLYALLPRKAQWGAAFVGLLAIGASGCGWVHNAPEILRPQSVLAAIFFYHVGTVVKEQGSQCFAKFFNLGGGLVGACALVAMQVLLLGLAGWPEFSFGDMNLRGMPVIFILTALMGCGSLLIGAKIIDAIPYIKNFFAYLGRNSLALLAVHPVCGLARGEWLARYSRLGSWSYLLEILVIAFCMYLLSVPLRFLLHWPTKIETKQK